MILLSLLNFSLYTHVEVDEDGVVHFFHIREKIFIDVHESTYYYTVITHNEDQE